MLFVVFEHLRGHIAVHHGDLKTSEKLFVEYPYTGR